MGLEKFWSYLENDQVFVVSFKYCVCVFLSATSQQEIQYYVKSEIESYYIPHVCSFVCPSKFSINIVSNISGGYHKPQEKLKTILNAKFKGGNKVHHGECNSVELVT